jgi:hypothetical protein
VQLIDIIDALVPLMAKAQAAGRAEAPATARDQDAAQIE